MFRCAVRGAKRPKHPLKLLTSLRIYPFMLSPPCRAHYCLLYTSARAGAEPLSGNIGIAEVLAERARELYYEENRHVELVRISYLYAKTGKPCEALGGRVYKLDNFSGPGGVGTNCKDAGVNFYFDWVMVHNNFFNKGVKIPNGEYRMSVHHVLWPVPETAITSNTGGVINQNIGYPGAEDNLEPLKVEPVDPAI